MQVQIGEDSLSQGVSFQPGHNAGFCGINDSDQLTWIQIIYFQLASLKNITDYIISYYFFSNYVTNKIFLMIESISTVKWEVC